DVIGGAAGGILGLLALAETGANGQALEPAIRCGDHLLEKRTATASGHQAWKVAWADRPLTGFGHGAAGIACTLARLGQATGEERFLDAAREAIAYETAVRVGDAGSWPDFRNVPGRQGPAFMNAWCHGAAGIGLGRLAGLPVL